MGDCVLCSNSYHKKVPGITFHRFPTDPVLRGKWLKALKCKDWLPSKNSRVCSAHFKEDDIYILQGNRARLKDDAVPCKIEEFLPSTFKMLIREAMDFPPSSDIKEALENHFKHPVIFKNSLKSWLDVPWTTEQLSNDYGDILLNFRIVPKSNDRIVWEGSTKYTQATINQFIEWQKGEISAIENTNPFHPHETQYFWAYSSYNYMSNIFHEDADILEAVDWTAYGYPKTSTKDSAFWIGSEGSYTPCHSDTYGFNLVAQIQGRKKWILFPPEDTSFMYPTRIPYEESSVFSSVNILKPDLKIHPLFKFSHPHVVILEPGDVLFVPNKWWHFVQSLDTTVSINTWIELVNDESHLEEGVTRALMSSFITFFEPTGESWVNPKEELALPEETLEYISLDLKKIKTLNTKQKPQEQSNSISPTRKRSKQLVESDMHSDILEERIQKVLNHKNIKCVSSETFSKWYGKSVDEHSPVSLQNVNMKTIIDCFVHPEVISLICNKLKNI